MHTGRVLLLLVTACCLLTVWRLLGQEHDLSGLLLQRQPPPPSPIPARQGLAPVLTGNISNEEHTSSAAPDIVLNDQAKGDTVMQIYMNRLKELTITRSNVPHEICPAVLGNHRKPCVVNRCNASFVSPAMRLRRILRTQHPVTDQDKTLIDNLAHQPNYTDLVFVTAASANHFDESQGLVKDMHQVVFPHLQKKTELSFRFFYYDLGLMKTQLNKLKKYCNCTVITFPFESLPYNFRKLPTCIWKPLVLKAHLRFSSSTVWMDVSTRFKTGNISHILQQAHQLGIFATRNSFMLPMHVHPAMLGYFQVEPCMLASFYETAGGFIVLNNDVFVHKAILDPWVACAFSPRCLCPSENRRDCESFLYCRIRDDPYFRCHRFDQSALGIILANLFDWRVGGLVYALHNDTTPWFSFKRGNRIKYFSRRADD